MTSSAAVWSRNRPTCRDKEEELLDELTGMSIYSPNNLSATQEANWTNEKYMAFTSTSLFSHCNNNNKTCTDYKKCKKLTRHLISIHISESQKQG